MIPKYKIGQWVRYTERIYQTPQETKIVNIVINASGIIYNKTIAHDGIEEKDIRCTLKLTEES